MPPGLKPKDLVGIPWRVAFALQAEGWYLRDAVVWHKPAPMPGAQRDRCTSSYELVFQLTKQEKYYFDLEAIKEPAVGGPGGAPVKVHDPRHQGRHGATSALARGWEGSATRTPRNVWTIHHEGYEGAHFATMPLELARKCVTPSVSERGCCSECGAPWVRVVAKTRAATRPGSKSKVYADLPVHPNSPLRMHRGTVGTNRDPGRHVTTTTTSDWCRSCPHDAGAVPCRVLDPFNGAGTTGVAARLLGHDYVGIELNPEYAAAADRRIRAALVGGEHNLPAEPGQRRAGLIEARRWGASRA